MGNEPGRRAVHVSGTAVPVAFLLDLLTWPQVRWLLAVAGIAGVVLEVIRLVVGLDWAVYEKLTREYEANNPAGYALALIGGAVVVWAFEPAVGVPALLMLTVGDPFAGILGSGGGPGSLKEWWVMGATFLLCLGIALPFLPPRAAVPAAAVAVVADSVKPQVAGYVVDDNFSIPVGSAVAAFFGATYVPVLLCAGACRVA